MPISFAHKTAFLMLLAAFGIVSAASGNMPPRLVLESLQIPSLFPEAREPISAPEDGGKKAQKDAKKPASSSGGKPAASSGKNAKSSGSASGGPGTAGAAGADGSPGVIWTLVLATFTDGDHATAAASFASRLRQAAPQIQGVRVHTTGNGSMVIYGSYAGRDDPKAEEDQQTLKAMTSGGQKLFSRVMLVRLDLRPVAGQLHPHNLLSARKAHPKVDPMYTLDIAIWLATDDDTTVDKKDRLTYEDVKKKAEAYCEKLRGSGFEAYFFHDDEKRASTVTVGLFDRRAIDSTSGLYSDDVEALVKKFPARLANGEPVYEYMDKFKITKKSKTKPQMPKLVLVPMI